MKNVRPQSHPVMFSTESEKRIAFGAGGKLLEFFFFKKKTDADPFLLTKILGHTTERCSTYLPI